MKLNVSIHLERWPMSRTFRITGLTKEHEEVVVVELGDGENVGRGEAVPVHYLGESAEGLCRTVESAAKLVEDGIDRTALSRQMAPGAARNAIDCALWDLEAKRTRRGIWELTGIEPKPLITVFTIGIEDSIDAMARHAAEAAAYRTLKVKLNADRPVERVEAIRATRPDVRLTVDANQAWTFDQLVEIAPSLERLDVQLIEQPLPRGADQVLEGYDCPIPLCADESCQHLGELAEASQRYEVINVKLDKAGGLTEALQLARAVRQRDRGLLVSCMGGTSLSMAPAFVLAQLCDFVELDGPMLLRRDRVPGLKFERDTIFGFDRSLWG